MSDLELESQLVRIWESVLRRRGIGVHDSFWDLGGNSLTALRLMRKVERIAGADLPVTTLLQVPTISEMAVLLRHSRAGKAWSSLVAIQPLGSQPPLFCVHAMGGLVMGFRSLARHLRPDQPVYGLQAQGIDGKGNILSRVEDMAAHYLEEVRAVQPRGPYYFAGRCFGGWIAFEMAQQLRDQGEEVGLLALFDTYFVNWSRGTLMRKLFRLPPSEMIRIVVQKGRLWGRIFVEPVQHLFLPRAIRPVREGLRVAAREYVPRPYAGRIILFQADEKSLRDSLDPTCGWGALATGRFEIQQVPGDHNSMFAEPQAAVLAQQLAACLEQVRGEATDAASPGLAEGIKISQPASVYPTRSVMRGSEGESVGRRTAR
jgi:thioesterase domain-containing protein